MKNTPHAKNLVGSPDAASKGGSAPAGLLICQDIADHDLENAVRVSRAKWRCPKCGDDVSLAFIFYQAALEHEGE